MKRKREKEGKKEKGMGGGWNEGPPGTTHAFFGLAPEREEDVCIAGVGNGVGWSVFLA